MHSHVVVSVKTLTVNDINSMNGVWYHYDGLWERNSRGEGLKKCTKKPSPLSLCVDFQKDFALKWPVSFDLL